MIKRLFLFFTGWVQIRADKNAVVNFLECLRDNCVECFKSQFDSEGNMIIVLSQYQYRKIKVYAFGEGISVSGIKGLPDLLRRLIKRPGIVLGIVFFIFISYKSGNIIWNIEVEGNEKVSDEEIITLLSELGCSYGNDFSRIDFDKLHSKFLVNSDNISWISVNMIGNCARVQVREFRPGDSDEKSDNVCANLVASETAQVLLMKVEEGIGCVNNGDIVNKGDILVSGVIPLREGGVRFCYASGEVLAYVPRTIEVSIPLENTEKVYTGREKEKKSVKFFKKSINLSINYGIEYTSYDKIEESERIYLFGVIPLPVWVDKVTFKEYQVSDTLLDVDAAVNAAVKELRFELDEVLKSCEIVRVKQNCDISDDVVTLKQELLCITDIAEVLEFTTDFETDQDG